MAACYCSLVALTSFCVVLVFSVLSYVFSYAQRMDKQLRILVLCLSLIVGLFYTSPGDTNSRSTIVYTREDLLALCSIRIPLMERLVIPNDIRRRRRGSRAGLKCWERKRRYKPCFPSIIMGNVRSLPNKMEELTALTRLQREYCECSIMCFTEAWLNGLITDSIVTLDG